MNQKLTEGMLEVNEMSKAAYARYKKVSKPMVTKWFNDGRLVMSDDGKRVKVKESDQRIKETAHLNGWANEQHAARERGEINKRIAEQAAEKTFEDLKSDVSETQLDLETKDPKELFENARALKEKAAALQAAAEHEKFIGSLVGREVVDKVIFERSRQFRDSLLTCARRVSPLVIGMDSVKDAESLLTEEFRNLLDNFSKLPVIR